MDQEKRKLKTKPYEQEDDFDWNQYKHQLEKEQEDDFDYAEEYTNIRDADLDITEGAEDAQTKGKQE